MTTSWPRIKRVAERIAASVDAASMGSYTEITIP
jgi:hypothetical protein